MKHLRRSLIGLSVIGLLFGSVAHRLPAMTANAQGGNPTLYLPIIQHLAGGPTLGGCAMFPPDNPWNTDISASPVHSNSLNFINDINAGGDLFLHADFGEFSGYGIPYVVVPGTQPFVPINLGLYWDESDPGPYPIPPDAPVEGGSDAHVLVLDSGACTLYELYHAQYQGAGLG